ncbi:hypothetical protein BC829DRAFT_252757 [Chytridium lagenaria]|nr:hypothetical protein BC829DRAFT_252757 [Chytridium lagenaria]
MRHLLLLPFLLLFIFAFFYYIAIYCLSLQHNLCYWFYQNFILSLCACSICELVSVVEFDYVTVYYKSNMADAVNTCTSTPSVRCIKRQFLKKARANLLHSKAVKNVQHGHINCQCDGQNPAQLNE